MAVVYGNFLCADLNREVAMSTREVVTSAPSIATNYDPTSIISHPPTFRISAVFSSLHVLSDLFNSLVNNFYIRSRTFSSTFCSLLVNYSPPPKEIVS